MVVLLGGCMEEEPEPPPSLSQQTAELSELAGERAGAHRIERGTVVTLDEDVRVGVHTTDGDAAAQLHVAVDAEVIEVVEVARGESVALDGYEVAVQDLGADAAWVAVTSPEGDLLTR